MNTNQLPITVAIPTLGRDEVLIATIEMLLEQSPRAAEILILDQSKEHKPSTNKQLSLWDSAGEIRWIHLEQPSQPAALNVAIITAKSPYLLFLDDDIRIDQGFLTAHYSGFESEAIWCVAGQVLQPKEEPDANYRYVKQSGTFADSNFCFRSCQPAIIENAMSGNMTVRREVALKLGGFDENFSPPVAFRFDNEFCKRLCGAGGQIKFQPSARIYHLRESRGGTRTNSNHLTSMSPEHGIGDYYFAMKHGTGVPRIAYICKRFLREVATRFHLKHPWWIPIKLIGELRACFGAWQLLRNGPKYLRDSDEQ